VQPHRHRGDVAERPVGAGEELGEVVTGDVLDHLSAGARHRAVGEHDRDAHDQVAHAAVTVAQRTGVGGRDEAADRGGVAGAERRVEREHLAGRRERRLRLGHGHARLEDRREVALVVLEDPRHAGRGDLDLRGAAHAAPPEFGAAAADAQRVAGVAERAQQLRCLGHGAGALGPRARRHPVQNRSARPAASSGCCR
jgi:hypothetical protein